MSIILAETEAQRELRHDMLAWSKKLRESSADIGSDEYKEIKHNFNVAKEAYHRATGKGKIYNFLINDLLA